MKYGREGLAITVFGILLALATYWSALQNGLTLLSPPSNVLLVTVGMILASLLMLIGTHYIRVDIRSR